MTFPSINTLLGKWAPPLERSRMVTITGSGLFFGNVIAFPLSGVLCQCGFAGGWPSVFYLFGEHTYTHTPPPHTHPHTSWLLSTPRCPMCQGCLNPRGMPYSLTKFSCEIHRCQIPFIFRGSWRDTIFPSKICSEVPVAYICILCLSQWRDVQFLYKKLNSYK